MKGLSFVASIAILCSVACQKTFDPLMEVAPTKATISTLPVSSNNTIEDLGPAIKGTNVFWKINPMFENLEPLFTYAPGSNSGIVALLIDNGDRGNTPLKFFAVNLLNNTSKTVYIKDKNGIQVTKSVGRVSRYMFGMNKKFYVATENGGHLIEYDPNTQTATDLGTPFNVDGRVLDIYSLSIGKDGALYGGSFGSGSDVYTFRYDYNNNFYVDKSALDGDAKYVTYVTGDDRYTYASCGQNSWSLYAIDRATGKKELLLESSNPADRIYLATYTDACYASFQGKSYRLNGTVQQNKLGDPARGAQVEYLPYQPGNPVLPKIAWSECDKKLYYKFPGATEYSVTLSDVTDESYNVSSMTSVGGKLFLTAGKFPRLVSYDKQAGFNCIGTPAINVYLMQVVPGTNGTKLVMGGYPKGAMLEYNTTQPWTMGTETVSYTPPDITSAQSNPRKFVQLQDADYSGVFGPMTLNGIFYTKDGTLIAAGNNDRLTGSGSRELSIGTFKNGVKRNFAIPEFGNYEFRSMCLSKDSSEVFISATSKYGAEGKIFKYNPVSNTVTANITIPGTGEAGIIQLYDNNLLIGSYNDVLYLLDVNTKKVVFTKTLGGGQRIHTFTIAPDHSVWINHAYLNVSLTKFEQFKFDVTDLKSISYTAADVTVMKNPDVVEGPLPTGLLFVKASTNSYDLYISGYKSLCRLSGACTVTM